MIVLLNLYKIISFSVQRDKRLSKLGFTFVKVIIIKLKLIEFFFFFFIL